MGQLRLEVEKPLRFNVYAADGRLLDSFTEDELATAGTEKTWHEATCWAVVAIKADRRDPGREAS